MTLKYRSDIDGLRAVSVLAVLFFHAGFDRFFGGGFVGVDVFFVISGYLIASQIYDTLSKGRIGFWTFLGSFYERRARRILPAFFFVSALAFAAAYLVFLPNRFEEFAKSLLAATLFSANLFFWSQDSYFSPEADTQPLLHYWSLGVEEHFYLLFPILIFFAWRVGIRYATGTLAIIFIASLVGSQIAVSPWPKTTFYWIPFRAWELLIGSLLALPFVPAPRRHSIAGLATAAGLVLICCSVVWYSKETQFPGFAALPPCLGAALVLWGGRAGNPISAVLGIKPASYVGLISYSLYLVHWPVIVFMRHTYPDMTLVEQATVALPLSLAIASFSYHFVEKPTRNRKGMWRVRPIVTLSAGGAVVSFALGSLALATDGFPSRLPVNVRQLMAYSYDRKDAYREGTCFLKPGQSFADIDVPTCLPSGARVALLWGDSFAAHYVQGLRPILEQQGFTFAQLNASQCPPIVGREAPGRPNCKSFNEFAFTWIMEHRPDLVIMSAYWVNNATALKMLEAELTAMDQAGINVAIIGQGPYYRDAVPTLLAARRLRGDSSNYSDKDLTRHVIDVDATMRKVVSKGRWETVHHISVLGTVCRHGSCPMYGNGTPYHWDRGHLTDVGSAVFAAEIGKMLVPEHARSITSRSTSTASADQISGANTFSAMPAQTRSSSRGGTRRHRMIR